MIFRSVYLKKTFYGTISFFFFKVSILFRMGLENEYYFACTFEHYFGVLF